MPNLWTRNIALLRYQVENLRDSYSPQMNAVTRLFYMSCRCSCLLWRALEWAESPPLYPALASGETTMQKYTKITDWQKNIFTSP